MLRTRNLGLRAEAGKEGGDGGGGTGAGDKGGGTALWYDGFKDAATKDWVKSYNDAYPDPESMAAKAMNLEKFLGADKAGRGIVIPKDLSKAEELTPIFRKLGAAETIDGYKVEETIAKDPVMVKLREHAHKIGMPVSHFNSTVQLLAGVVKEQQATQSATLEQKAETDLNELHTEWAGPEYDKQVELGRRAAKMFVPHKDADELEQILGRMEGALGTKFMMKLWSGIGAGLAEHSFVGDGDRPSGGMTPEAARVRITELKADKDFGAKLIGGDVATIAEWNRLNQIASSDRPQLP